MSFYVKFSALFVKYNTNNKSKAIGKIYFCPDFARLTCFITEYYSEGILGAHVRVKDLNNIDPDQALQNLAFCKGLNLMPLTQQCKHYENTPIQIYRKFYNQKRKIFR